MHVDFNTWQCQTRFGQYPDGSIAIQLVGEDFTNYPVVIATATVYLQKTPGNIVGIKNWSENSGMVRALMKAGVIKGELLYKLPTGYVEAEYYQLTEEALKEIERMKEGA